MINKIIASSLLFFLLIAIAIKLIDPSITYVSLGKPFLDYMGSCSYELNNFKIAIPDIPKIEIDRIIEPNDTDDVLNFFKNFARGFFTFVNVIVSILNILSDIINIVISLIEFIVIMIKNFQSLRDNFVDNSTSEPNIDFISSSAAIFLF